MNFTLSKRSLNNLKGVHPDLIAVAKKALTLTEVDFGITEGLRSVERQKELLKAGKTETLNSRHLTGHAIDVVAYVNNAVSWELELYEKIAQAMQEASQKLGIPVEWGGKWKSKDGPHFQLPWKEYKA
jgi:peptidoglycan L-alanyl-D-glutamate endopeptidase CwlK